ncbi:MAG: RNA ligase family protein [Lachnospiraceae bacterium]|nr:RNA ligase family protein [Lachnospiraceae bacterium]
MKHKSFMDIERYKTSFNDGFEKGDHIVIQEKIDGANCAIRYDSETDTVVAQSRKKILNLENSLRGFWEWSQTLSKEAVKSILGNNLILFAEWLVPHSVKYPDDRYKKVYCYDVYDTETEHYLPQDKVKDIIAQLGLTYVPVFYDGEFISWEHCIEFVGKTELGGEYGEGIVIKNQTKLNNPNTRLPFYTKIVSASFAETKGHKQKVIDPEKIKAVEENKSLAETIVTKARVEKLLNKFVDEGVLPEDWSSREMSIVAKNLNRAVYDDCIKEEPETVKQIDNFGKVANGIAMSLARLILNERDGVAV